ncbi:uncharacterized protein [Nyctibius grandis]|uniref:uncharacterized protein isoform X4 n=1 Tax=Nyctibius grandis TaxID=48427 RepID=UPI0035BC1E74
MGQPTFRSGLKLQSWSRGALPQAAASLSRLWAAEKEIWLFPKTSLQGLITSTSGTQESWTLGLHFSRAKTRRPAVRVKINTLFKRFNCLTPRKPVVLRRCLSGMTRFQWRFRGVEETSLTFSGSAFWWHQSLGPLPGCVPAFVCLFTDKLNVFF